MDKIEIIEGHDESSYFWIMPIKIIDYSKPTNDIHNAIELRKEEISIEEEIVEDFLFEYLNRNFDENLKENLCRDNIFGNIFEWNLEYNFYTLEKIKVIIEEISSDIKKIESNTYSNQERIERMGSYLYFYLDKNSDGENKSQVFWKYKDIVIEFYNRFISYMNNMIKEAKENGYELISFMGP